MNFWLFINFVIDFLKSSSNWRHSEVNAWCWIRKKSIYTEHRSYLNSDLLELIWAVWRGNQKFCRWLTNKDSKWFLRHQLIKFKKNWGITPRECFLANWVGKVRLGITFLLPDMCDVKIQSRDPEFHGQLLVITVRVKPLRALCPDADGCQSRGLGRISKLINIGMNFPWFGWQCDKCHFHQA